MSLNAVTGIRVPSPADVPRSLTDRMGRQERKTRTDANAAVRAGRRGAMVFNERSTLTVSDSDEWEAPVPLSVFEFVCRLSTASSSGSVVVVLKKNGTTTVATVTLAASATRGRVAVQPNVSMDPDAEDYLTTHVTSAGTGAAGLVAQPRWKETGG